MLPKLKRMSQKEVDLVFSAGKYFKNKLFSGKYIKNTTFKCSVAPAKKTFKTAVSRNKVKRRIFSAIAHIKPLPPIHIAIIPEKSTLDISFSEITSAFKEFLV